jgi:hypothetical protein
MTARQQQYTRDNDLWETNRMLTSGVVQRMDNSAEDEGNDFEVFFQLLFFYIHTWCINDLLYVG